MASVEIENDKPSKDWLSILLVLTYPIWAIAGGWIGWLINGWIGVILGLVISSFFFILGIGQGGVYPKNAEDFVFDLFMIIGAPIGAAIGFFLSGSIVWLFIGAISGFILGSIFGVLVVKILGRIYPKWTPEAQQRVEDEPKLEAYFKQMEDLNLSEDASDSVRNHAREITLAVLPNLHSEAKWKVLSYLSKTSKRHPEYPAGLISRGHRIVDIQGANLTGQCNWSDLYHFDLSGTDLRKAKFGSAPMADIDLSEADLRQANLGFSLARADFSGADLREASLSGAHLSGANFSHADLRGADLNRAFGLEEAVFDQANYDSKTKWPEDFNPKSSGAVMDEK